MAASDVTPRRSQRNPKKSKGDLNERALLDSAARMLARGEFADASVAEIADAAGISRGAFYFYFSSKNALLATLVDEAVSQFNATILSVVAEAEALDAASAVSATVEAAARLWWNHSDVLRASIELGAASHELYERSAANFALVRTPTVALLQRYGTVPEAENIDDATELVMFLTFMVERTFYDLMSGHPTEEDRDRVTARLTRVWLRAFGLEPAE